MNQHPYLRAYLAGIAVPTCFMLVVFTVFCIARFVCQVPVPIERAIVFPLALIPNAFGAWNMLFVALHRHCYLPLGIHGAILPFIIAPIGFLIATSLGFLVATGHGLVWFQTITIDYSRLALIFPAVPIIYYLVWKHLVGFLNEMLGIAG
ncbi:MAG: hypothetical protein LAN63_12755 [Acidobacteriia bacterium]|nr:hypothetical protein [Terriglobia bacterium]